jgi:hypothetical protein
MEKVTFEQLGFYKEYWIDNKFIGCIQCEKDREVFGFNGSKKEVPTEKIILDNKKTIRPFTEVTTYLFPLCGKKLT